MGWFQFIFFIFFFDVLIDGLKDSILESRVLSFEEESLISLKIF